tara:strand:+ start:9464 stop:9709 length:246 start_codon:yes stop_codon:yes gene_type:complete
MNRKWINKNLIQSAIIVFIFLYLIVISVKPGFIYNNNDTLREFGLGQSKKTILPLWLMAIILAISSYFLVTVYLMSPRLNY